MKQKKKYPKTAMVIGTIAFVLFLAGFGNFAFFFSAGFLGLIALIFVLGPDDQDIVYYDPIDMWGNTSSNAFPIRTPSLKTLK